LVDEVRVAFVLLHIRTSTQASHQCRVCMHNLHSSSKVPVVPSRTALTRTDATPKLQDASERVKGMLYMLSLSGYLAAVMKQVHFCEGGVQ
jgi:hypothetical protein